MSFKTEYHDPFDQPFPSKKDCMQLSSISKSENKTHTRTQFSETLVTNDIMGSKPQLRGQNYTNKPQSTSLITDDICGGQRSLKKTFISNSRETNKTNDIDGTQPQSSGPKWHKSTRTVDPLNPVQILPSFQALENPDTRFIRDNINIDDIDTKKHSPLIQTRNKLRTDDIFGASSSQLHKARVDQNDSLKVQDINDKNKNKTTRSTNPLDPVYFYRADAEFDEPIEIGHISGSQSRARTKEMSANNLKTIDIQGAQASTIKHTCININSGEPRLMNNTHDIYGAQSNTLKKSFSSNRKTDPLSPNQILPGHKEQKQKEYIEKIKNDQERENSSYIQNASKFYNSSVPTHGNNIPYGYNNSLNKFYTGEPENTKIKEPYKSQNIISHTIDQGKPEKHSIKDVASEQSKINELLNGDKNFKKSNQRFHGERTPLSSTGHSIVNSSTSNLRSKNLNNHIKMSTPLQSGPASIDVSIANRSVKTFVDDDKYSLKSYASCNSRTGKTMLEKNKSELQSGKRTPSQKSNQECQTPIRRTPVEKLQQQIN